MQRYPELSERHKVSVGGGGKPQWRSDQSELFYIAADRALVADGGKFLLDNVFGDGGDTAITVVVNWSAEAESSATLSSRYLD